MTFFTIRPAGPADESAVLPLADRLSAFGPTTRSEAEIAIRERRALAEALAAPRDDQHLLVAEQPGIGIVGVILLERRADYFTGAAHGHVAILAVAKVAEGRGVGGALLQAADAWALERGFKRLTLSVFAENVRAQQVYGRQGWKPELLTYVKDLG